MYTDVVILAGGRGERFWPLSRRSRPKQVLRLLGDDSLLRATVKRSLIQVGPERVWGVAPKDLRDVLTAEAPEIAPERWIWETEGRNTAPAVAGAVAAILEQARRCGEGDRRVLVLPADHWIPDPEAFWAAVEAGERIVDESGRLVTFGITVTRPETGYGYIERGERIEGAAVPSFVAKQFHEKPELAEAEAYRESGSFYWNAGIFLFSAAVMAEEIRRHVPDLAGPFDSLSRALGGGRDLPDGAQTAAGAEAIWDSFFSASPAIALDHAVMEKSDRVAVVESPFTWDDLGSWTSWGDHARADGKGNRTRGVVLTRDASSNVVYSEDGGVVALLGVRDLVVVRTGDAVLVCPQDRVQEIRELVREGRASGLESF